MKFNLVNGKIKFLAYTIEWTETKKIFNQVTNKLEDGLVDRTRDCYSAEEKDALVARLTIRNITPVVTELEQPSAELLASCVGKVFSSYDDAVAFVNGTYVEPLTLESLAEVVADMIGGVI